MHSKLTIPNHGLCYSPPCFRLSHNHLRRPRKFHFHVQRAAPPHHGVRFKLLVQSLGGKRELHGIEAIQGSINSWLLKTQNFLSEVTSPVVKGHIRMPDPESAPSAQDIEDIFVGEQTIDSRTPSGNLSLAAIISIEQFRRSEKWVLEFVDIVGEMRRDVWHAFISEVISLYPQDHDLLVVKLYRSEKGKDKVIASVVNSIARLQTLQFIRKLSNDPIKLVEFSYLRNAPYGDTIFQTLAVNYWGGRLMMECGESNQSVQNENSAEMVTKFDNHVFNIDGSIYLQNWKRSPSWSSTSSLMFWNNCLIRQGIVLSKDLLVAGMTMVERAATICKEKVQNSENAQSTIDAAMLKGIPSNIDLFKEIILPFIVIVESFEKLRRWEEPLMTMSFLGFAYGIIFRNLLSYVIPISLMLLGTSMLLLKGLKEQGRLGKSFGEVKIRDQPPSNTIKNIIAVKGAMDDLESFLQNLNVSLLKIRTVILSGQPEVTAEVATVLLISGIVLLVVPFKIVLAFLLFDLFTRELHFRREMVEKFMNFLKERWATVPATRVTVLPFDIEKNSATKQRQESDDEPKSGRT